MTVGAAITIAQAEEERRRQSLAGGYRLRVAETAPAVTLVGVGAVMPEALAAADALSADGHPHTLGFLAAIRGVPIAGAAADLLLEIRPA